MVSIILIAVSLALAPIIAGGMGELTNGLVQIPILIAAIASVIEVIRRKSEKSALPGGTLFLAIFLVLTLLTSLFTECAYNSIKQWIFWFTCILSLWISSQSFTDKKKAMLPVVILSLVATGICLYTVRDQAITSGGGADFWKAISSGEQIRVFGTFINPNFFGGFLIISIPVTIALFLTCEGLISTLVFSVSTIVQIFTLMLTSSKFSTIALVAALLFFLLPVAFRKLLKRREWIRLALILIIILAVLIPSSASLKSRVSESSAGGTQVHSTAFRIYTWKATAKMIADKPFTGVGLGNFDIAFPRYAIAALTKHAHQSFLQIGAESGALAMLAFIAGLLGIAFGLIKGLWKMKRNTENELFCESLHLDAWPVIGWAILGGLIGSAGRNLVDSDWFFMGTSVPFFVMAGTLAAVIGSHKGSSRLNSILSGFCCIMAVACIIPVVLFAQGDYLANIDKKPGHFKSAAEAVKINPNYYRLYASRESSSYSDAIDIAGKAIKLTPRDGANYFCRASIYLSQFDYNKARADLEESLKLNPHSTQIMKLLAEVYIHANNTSMVENILNRMLLQEDSPYETVKGVPELVDTNYAYAHIYFADKLYQQGKYKEALVHLIRTTDRLERWRKGGQYLEIARISGTLTKDDEIRLLNQLRSSYQKMIYCYEKTGEYTKAGEAKTRLQAIY